jgi:hypothetical protein
MKITRTALLVLALLLPGLSHAADPREKAALTQIGFDPHELNYAISFLPGRPGYRAMTLGKEHRIEVYVRPHDDSQLLAYDIAHELGHVIDLTYNTEESRRQWMKARGIDANTPWFGCNRCSDYKTPSGDFAETFAFLLLGPGHFAGRIAPPPSARQIPELISLLPKILSERLNRSVK